jgi:hypothetical protein
VHGRLLICTRCNEPVEVHELVLDENLTAAEWINPDEYVCGRCLEHAHLTAADRRQARLTGQGIPY